MLSSFSLLLRRQLLPSFPRISHATRSFSSTSSSQLARILLVGHLAADPEVHTVNGKEIVRYVVGTEYGRTGNRQTSWFRVANFAADGPNKEISLGLQKGLTSGPPNGGVGCRTLVAVEGDAALRKIEDNDGSFRSVLNITQRHVEVLRRPSNRASAESGEDAADSLEGGEPATSPS
ncbi:MAG: ssDNA-binding protein, mitochondrial [Peltula sp. TS41687]|nr:MAG: ssDNA-binding protein, mitochondrial [Peltula sp. TS41687]